MHYITDVRYKSGYVLHLVFENSRTRRVDLEDHLDGEVFEPLKNLEQFQTVHLNKDIDTVAWSNGADMSPDFLYEISEPVDIDSEHRVAESGPDYGDATNEN